MAAGGGQGPAVDGPPDAVRAARRRPARRRLARAPGARGERAHDRRRARGHRAIEPPSGAQTRFSTNGIEVVSSYALEAAGAGSGSRRRSRPSRAGSPRACSCRWCSRGSRRSSRRTSSACGSSSAADRARAAAQRSSLLLVAAPAAAAQDDLVAPAARALQSDSVYVAPGVDVDVDEVREEIADRDLEVNIAVMPDGTRSRRRRAGDLTRWPARKSPLAVIGRQRAGRGPAARPRARRPPRRRGRTAARAPRPCWLDFVDARSTGTAAEGAASGPAG